MYTRVDTDTDTHTQSPINLIVNQKKKKRKIRKILGQKVYRNWWLIGVGGNGKVLAPEKYISPQVFNPFPFYEVSFFK